MNILLIAPQPFYQNRGTPIAVKLLAQTLGELGHKVHLLVFPEGEDIALPNVTVHRSPAIPGITHIKPGFSLKKLICDFFLFWKCVRLVRKYEVNLLHAVEESAFMALVIKKIFKIPYVYDMDSCMSMQLMDKFSFLRPVRSIMEGMEKMAVAGSSGVVAVCRALEETARTFAPDKLIARIEDVTLLTDDANGRESLRERFTLSGPIIMYVGNLERYQGVDLLIESFAKALASTDKDLNLIIIGGAESDIEQCRQRAKQLGIEKKVYFCGPRPVELLGSYLRQADILVSPRIQGNNTPMKIYSYLDSGKPVLATRIPSHTQVLDEQIAYLVDPTVADMAAGITMLAEDQDLGEKIGRKARQRVQEEYSLAAFRKKLAEFYQRLSLALSDEKGDQVEGACP